MPTPYPWKEDEENQQQQGIGPSNPEQMVQQQQEPQMSREQWRDAWMGQGQITPDQADSWLSSHGATELGNKAGVWRTPSGDVLDLQIGRGGAKATGGKITAGWTQVGDQGGGQQQQGGMSQQNMQQSGIAPSPMNSMQKYAAMYGGNGQMGPQMGQPQQPMQKKNPWEQSRRQTMTTPS